MLFAGKGLGPLTVEPCPPAAAKTRHSNTGSSSHVHTWRQGWWCPRGRHPHPCHRPAKGAQASGRMVTSEKKRKPETRFPRRIRVALKHLFLGVYQNAGEKPCWLVLGASLDWTLPIGSDDGMWAFAPHLVRACKASYSGGGAWWAGQVVGLGTGVWPALPHPHPCMYTVKCSRHWGGKRFVCCPEMYLTKGRTWAILSSP